MVDLSIAVTNSTSEIFDKNSREFLQRENEPHKQCVVPLKAGAHLLQLINKLVTMPGPALG